MGLFTLHNCCFSWSLDFLKLKIDSQSRLTIPELSGYHCTLHCLIMQYTVCLCSTLFVYTVSNAMLISTSKIVGKTGVVRVRRCVVGDLFFVLKN